MKPPDTHPTFRRAAVCILLAAAATAACSGLSYEQRAMRARRLR